jgi:formylglycine-generating enzyme required for sulfatase activity
LGNADGLLDERPAHMAAVPEAFWMGSFEVTNQQYAAFDSHHDSRLEHGDFLQFSVQERGYPVNGACQPVARVSWEQAMAFCAWLSEQTGEPFTLPTEAEWEYACRARTATPLSYGALNSPFEKHANLADASLLKVDSFAPWSSPACAIQPWRPAIGTVNDGHRVSAPVGSYAANPWGLYDMHGNAAEWTRSVYTPYPYDSSDGRNDLTAPGKRVVRGGSWYDRPKRARAAFRLAYAPWRQVFNVGFRVACPVMGKKLAKSR